MSVERPIPVERAPEGSINWHTNQLPALRYSHRAKGLILLLPINGLVVVPFEQYTHTWSCVVVSTSWADLQSQRAYPVGGYNIDVGDDEIETALEVLDLNYNPLRDPGYLATHPELAQALDRWARRGVE